jgi:thymidylate synthase ThyX
MSSLPPPTETNESVAQKDHGRRIYLMKDLPPEVIAVAFAKTSRSPEPFDQIAAELTETSSAKFHEKWVVGYGHASVAEHAILSLAVENVSILAAKAIEDNRLASYTEKSTRYQVYDPRRVYRPAEFASHPELEKKYELLITTLLETYIRWSGEALTYLKRQNPKPEKKSGRLWEGRLRARACDAIRYLLPAATLTNLGWTVNARALAYAIRKLGASPLNELRTMATELRAAAESRVPTLLKYCDPDTARREADQAVRASMMPRIVSPPGVFEDRSPEARLLHCDDDALERLTCAVAYSNQPADWDTLRSEIRQLSTDDKLALLRASVAPLGPHDPLPRPFEYLNYIAEITVDYGAWRDIQRHRIATQTPQELSPDVGFTVPDLIDQLNLRTEFIELLEHSAATYDALHSEFPHEAVYALMLAFRKRSLFGWNLREIFHFVRLRGTAKGHAAYRHVAIELWRAVLSRQPWLGEFLFPLGPDFRPHAATH